MTRHEPAWWAQARAMYAPPDGSTGMTIRAVAEAVGKSKTAVWLVVGPPELTEARRAAYQAWAKAHPDKMREYSRRWRERHPERDGLRRLRSKLRNGGLPPEAIAAHLAKHQPQGDRHV